MNGLLPEHPHDAGLAEAVPDESHIEGAELLANEVRNRLRSKGFTDAEIDEWALTYISSEHNGDAGSFLEWISAHEQA